MKSDFKFSNLCGTVYKQGNLLYTPDGNHLISPVGNRITVFDLVNNKSYTSPYETSCNIVRLALSPKGNLLFLIDEDGRGLLVNFLRQKILHKFNFGERIRDIQFSPDGKYFAFTQGKLIQVWKVPGSHRELAPFVHVKNFTGHYDDVTSIQWSANSKLLLTSSKDLSAKLFNLGKPKKNFPLTLSGHRDNVVNSFFSKDGTSIYTVSRDGQVCHWKNTTLMSVLEDKGVEIEDRGDNDYLEESKWMVTERHYLEQPGKVTSATFHADTSMLLVGFDNGIFGLWEMPDFVNIHTLSISQHRINTVAVNNTGEWLAFGSSEFGQLLVWEWQSESYILKQQGHFYDMNTMAYSPDGQTIATGGHDGKLKVWNTTSGFCFVTFTDHSAPITAIEFTKNGQVIISASLDGTVRAFDLKRYRNFRTFTSPSPAQFSCMTVDPSGDIICAGSNDTFEIYVWSLQTGRLLEVLAGHEAPVSGISFSPNHNIFASGSWDKTVRIWDIFGRTHYTESIQMKAEVLSLAYRPDGKQLAVSTLDGEISFWDSDSGNNMGAIEGRKDISGGRKDNDMISAANSSAGKSFNSLCYTADGKAIIGGGNSKYVCIYDCLTHVLIKKFQITHNRSLDGTLEFLNSKNMTDAGPMDLVDDEDDDRDIAFRKGNHNLPGVVKGDLSDRKVKPEAKTKSVKFCPTGRSWAAASTEGLLIYSLDDTLVFDPFELEMDITPDSVLSTLTNKQYLHALIMAFKLNEPQVTVKVFESIPSSDIPLISSQLPEKYLPMALKFLITYSESGSPHLEFIILWTLELFTHHGRSIKSNLNLHLPNIRGIQKVLTKRYQDLSKLCEDNLYLMRYLIDASKLNQTEQEEIMDEEELLNGGSEDGEDDFNPFSSVKAPFLQDEMEV